MKISPKDAFTICLDMIEKCPRFSEVDKCEAIRNLKVAWFVGRVQWFTDVDIRDFNGIVDSFDWDSTPQGFLYWQNIFDTVRLS